MEKELWGVLEYRNTGKHRSARLHVPKGYTSEAGAQAILDDLLAPYPPDSQWRTILRVGKLSPVHVQWLDLLGSGAGLPLGSPTIREDPSPDPDLLPIVRETIEPKPEKVHRTLELCQNEPQLSSEPCVSDTPIKCACVATVVDINRTENGPNPLKAAMEILRTCQEIESRIATISTMVLRQSKATRRLLLAMQESGESMEKCP